ncbi:hypothetical protein [Nocardioides sp. SR21]|uniref:hypothetical protein n=1 Tax=Nocardioides sp. SR21 TaxID=2919501 RepID=UPI001FA94CEC|nr:hypothetical protein [Nocardioides sp. SR21]
MAVERARLTVVPRRRTRAARMPFVALVSLVLVGGVVGLLLFNTSMQQASFAATALEGQSTTLAAREQMLEMELDELRDPQRIAGAAQRLGMVQACAPAFIKLGSNEVVGQPCAAVASAFPIWPAEPKLPADLNPPPNVVEVTADPVVESGVSDDTADGATGNRARDGKKNQQQHQSQNSQR